MKRENKYSMMLAFCAAIFSVLLSMLAISQGDVQSQQSVYYYSLDRITNEFVLDLNDAAPAAQNKSIDVYLEYSVDGSKEFDNGTASTKGLITMDIDRTKFSWLPDKSKLCSKWEVFSEETSTATIVCHGGSQCCNYMYLEPIQSSWNDEFKVYLDRFGASSSNIVTVQLLYLDKDSVNPANTEILYTEKKSLPARFIDTPIDISGELAQLRQNSRLSSAQVVTEAGSELAAIPPDEKIDIVLAANASGKTARSIKNVTVVLSDLDSSFVDWNQTSSLVVKFENDTLKAQVASAGITPAAIVTVTGSDEVANGQDYNGEIRFEMLTGFNTVLFCPDGPQCAYVFPCKGDELPCYRKNFSTLIVYLPHFSSIIVGTDNKTANVTIYSPQNDSAYYSGENILLNFTINETVNATYSLDFGSQIFLGTNTSFSLMLNTTSSFPFVSNGSHTASLYLTDIAGNNYSLNYTFTISDTYSPNISVNVSNATALVSRSFVNDFRLTSTEFGNLSYRLNQGNFTEAALDSNKSVVLNLTLSNGSNTLLINLSDLNRNLNLINFTFTFLINHSTNGTCSNGILDYHNGSNETGIDCGGPCSACTPLNITTDKSSYNVSDQVLITVSARANSTVNISITGSGSAYRHASTSFPTYYIFTDTSVSGNYTINGTLYYLNNTENQLVYFLVTDLNQSITLGISASSSSADELEPITFAASVSGNLTGLTYRWDFENDGAVDSTNSTAVFRYTLNGSYTVNLTINATNLNKTALRAITIGKAFNITVNVYDNTTGSPVTLENASVNFDDETKYTNASEPVTFKRGKGDYILSVSKSSYIGYSEEIDVSSNLTLNISLYQLDESSPSVYIISPANNTLLTTAAANLTFRIIDDSNVTCAVHFSEDALFFNAGASITVLSSEPVFDAQDNLQDKPYYWRVRCTDERGNTNISDIHMFMVNKSLQENALSFDSAEKDKEIEGYIREIDEISNSLQSLPTKEREAAEDIQLLSTLDKSKVALQRISRDFEALKWRKLNSSDLAQSTSDLLASLEKLRNETPRNIRILDSQDFVKYPVKEDVRYTLRKLLNYSGVDEKKIDMNGLIEATLKLQNELSATVRYRKIELEHMSGSTRNYAVISKSLKTSQNLSGKILIEVIPKEIASSVSELKILNEYEIVEKDPIISIPYPTNNKIVYLAPERAAISDVENTKTILINTKLDRRELSKLTGFSVASQFKSYLISSKNKRLLAEIAIILLLVFVYLAYAMKDKHHFSLIFNRKARKFREQIEDAHSYLSVGNYEKAKKVYASLGAAFRDLTADAKALVYDDIVDLHYQLEMVYIEKKIGEAKALLKEGNHGRAGGIYIEIAGIYRNFPRAHKKEILAKCNELHALLNAVKR